MNKGGQIEKPTELYCCLLKCVYGTHKEYGEKANYLLGELGCEIIYIALRDLHTVGKERLGILFLCIALLFPSECKAFGELL